MRAAAEKEAAAEEARIHAAALDEGRKIAQAARRRLLPQLWPRVAN